MIRVIHAAAPYSEVRRVLGQEAVDASETQAQVAEIIRSVIERGDRAVLELTARFDSVEAASLDDLRVPAEELERAAATIDPVLLGSLRAAAENIRAFHEKQVERGFIDFLPDGSILGQRVSPLSRVGVYVPGGRAAYPSSVLMNVLPARAAGVERVIMVSPAREGRTEPVVLAAAHVAGVDEFYRIGGAQAVAALAYGTETLEPVDKIVGPGNRWVAEAKRQVYGRVDIDMIAGPSEILVVADGDADPRVVAADLIGQAEHDPDAIAWLVTDSDDLAQAVVPQLEALLAANPRQDVARAALAENGLIVVVPDLDAAADVANLRAAEHVEVQVRDPIALAGRIRNAGALFLGAHTAEPLGDYFAGPNHVLPTGGTARWASPLGAYDFLKRTSVIGYSRGRLEAHAEDVIRLAEAEGLFGHAETIRVRLGRSSSDGR